MISLDSLSFVPRTENGVTTEKAVAPLPHNLRLTVTRIASSGFGPSSWPLATVEVLRGDKRFPDSFEVCASVTRPEVDEDELDSMILACQLEAGVFRAHPVY